MSKTIRARPNQSLLDMILTEYGTLETGMEVAAQNNVAISHIPIPGSIIEMPTLTDTQDREGIAYLRKNEIVLGTLALPSLGIDIILKPRMIAVPTAVGDPHVIGYYAFDMVGTAGFLNANPLDATYISENQIYYISEERYFAGLSSELAIPITATPMPDKIIPYQLPWSVGFGYMIVWCDLTRFTKTATYIDINGNRAYYSPVTVLDNASQAVLCNLMGDISLEVVSSTPAALKLRLTRFHDFIALSNFRSYTMDWLHDAAMGAPDPYDPLNEEKTILTLPPGTYTIGVRTNYQYTGTIPATPYPSSAFSMVIHVS